MERADSTSRARYRDSTNSRKLTAYEMAKQFRTRPTCTSTDPFEIPPSMGGYFARSRTVDQSSTQNL